MIGRVRNDESCDWKSQPLSEEAIGLVLKQAEALADDWTGERSEELRLEVTATFGGGDWAGAEAGGGVGR